MKQLIVNSDDYGMSKEINAGIQKAIKSGIVSSVSLMVNMPHIQSAVSFLKKNRQVSTGLHFNFTEGTGLSKSKNNQSIKFSGLIRTLLWLLLKKNSLSLVEKELILQYKKLKQTGLKITHIDTHQHLHIYPPVFRLLLNFSHKHKIATLRCCTTQARSTNLKQFIITTGYKINYYFLKNSTLKKHLNTHYIHDLNWSNNFNQISWNKLLSELPEGTTELICHPGNISKIKTAWDRKRYNTLLFLTNPNTINAIKKNKLI